MLKVGPDQTEHGRPEQKPAEELSHDRRLAELLHEFAEAAADQQQNAQLGEKDRFGTAGRVSLRGERDRDAAEQNDQSE